MTRILGVDPGLTRYGVGIIDAANARSVSFVDVSVIRSPADDPLEKRLLAIRDGLNVILDEFRPDVIAIGSSTGGPQALFEVLSHLKGLSQPILITQHMPATFTKSFAARLDRISGAHVAEAHDGARLLPGHIYVAPGGDAHLEVVGSTHPTCRLREAAGLPTSASMPRSPGYGG